MKRLLINDLPYDVPAAVFEAFKSLGSEVDRLSALLKDAPHADKVEAL